MLATKVAAPGHVEPMALSVGHRVQISMNVWLVRTIVTPMLVAPTATVPSSVPVTVDSTETVSRVLLQLVMEAA